MPYLLGNLISFFTTNPNNFTEQQAYLIATGLSVSVILTVIIFHPCQIFYGQVGIRLKSACCSLICRKVNQNKFYYISSQFDTILFRMSKISQLSKHSMKDGVSGQAINLMSNDVSRLDLMVFFINNVWNAPIGSFIAGIMIYLQIGYSGLIGLIILVCTMPIYSETINAILYQSYQQLVDTYFSYLQPGWETYRRNSSPNQQLKQIVELDSCYQY